MPSKCKSPIQADSFWGLTAVKPKKSNPLQQRVQIPNEWHGGIMSMRACCQIFKLKQKGD